MNQPLRNALSFDVEDYFHGKAFQYLDREDWNSIEGRVWDNTAKILDILDRAEVKATFFFLGWVGVNNPDLVKRVQSRGHEIASHGYWHRTDIDSPGELLSDIELARKTLEDIIGGPVYGHRLPSFANNNSKDWFLEVVKDASYYYDSSLYPAYHRWYRWDRENRKPHQTSSGILEAPMSSVPFSEIEVPLGGGGYLRVAPVWFYTWGIGCLNRMGIPANIYLHPHDLDPDCPQPDGAGLLRRMRRRVRLGDPAARLEKLLQRFSFARIMDILPSF